MEGVERNSREGGREGGRDGGDKRLSKTGEKPVQCRWNLTQYYRD